MKKGVIFTAFLTLLFVIPFVSASITLPTLDHTYNLGDQIASTIGVEQSSSFDGYVKLDLQCTNSSNNFFAMPFKFSANSQKQIDVPEITLTSSGECYVDARIEDSKNNVMEEKQSPKFNVSDSMDIQFTVNKDVFLPDEEVKIEGSAVKADGKNADGNALVTIDAAYSAKVNNGKFSFSETLGKNTRSGNYTVKISAEDEYGNHGEAEKQIKIGQVPTSISIYLNNNSFNPGDKITASAQLIDQTGDVIDKEISMTLYDSWGVQMKVESVKNGTLEYVGNYTDSPGNWWVYAFSDNIKARKFLYINEVRSIDASISGNVLNVANIGNSVYNNPIIVTFTKDGKTSDQTIDLDIGVGKTASFPLTGDGNYSVELKSNDFSKNFDATLTGGTVGVKTPESPVRFAVAVIFILAIVVAAGIFRKRRQISIKETVTVNPNRI